MRGKNPTKGRDMKRSAALTVALLLVACLVTACGSAPDTDAYAQALVGATFEGTYSYGDGHTESIEYEELDYEYTYESYSNEIEFTVTFDDEETCTIWAEQDNSMMGRDSAHEEGVPWQLLPHGDDVEVAFDAEGMLLLDGAEPFILVLEDDEVAALECSNYNSGVGLVLTRR